MNIRPIRPDPEKKSIERRWNVQQRKDDFIGWVNELGIERTWAGKLAHNLDDRFNLRRVAWLFLFTLFLAFVLSVEYQVSYKNYAEGGLAAEDIRSPLSFEFIDQVQTHQRRIEAENSVPPSYDFDDTIYAEQVARVHQAFRTQRESLPNIGAFQKNRIEHNPFFLGRLSEFEAQLGGAKISEGVYEWLVRNHFHQSIENAVVSALESARDKRIMTDKAELKSSTQDQIILNVLERGGTGEVLPVNISTLEDLRDVRRRFTAENPQLKVFGPTGSEAVAELVRSLIVPNLTLNKQETEIRKLKARESVAPVIVKKRKGEIIVREKAPMQPEHVRMLNEVRRLQARQSKNFVALVTALFLVTILLCFVGFIGRFVSHVYITVKDGVAMGSVLVVTAAMSKFFLFVATMAFVDRFPSIPASFYYYILPTAAASMMVGLLIPFGEVVWLFTLFNSIIVGLMSDFNFVFMITTFTSGVVAARGVYGCKKRDQLYLAGLKTGLVNAILIFCATVILKQGADGITRELAFNSVAGFLAGLFSSFVTLTLVPFWETVFNYTTDVKLLELSNLNHPLLRDLIVKAPGTYHHSLVVGSMCEAAAESIGANSLLAKVTAYYHDIGKMSHAQYFIENQRPGENKHDQISPGMSKTILVAHVKDGVDMGLKYKLGKPIIDVIEQHHGTTLISFFYQRAKEQEDPSLHQATEHEYRYPGPKPQFREAALCMLADSIEAAARCLDEPTPARLQSIVRNIVQKKFLDGQLDECDLTLRDLTVIEEAFSRILLGIYHHRIDYPTSPKPTRRTNTDNSGGAIIK